MATTAEPLTPTPTPTPTPTTLRAAAGLPTTPPPLSESALVIIDAQTEYTSGALPLPHAPQATARIVELLTAARQHRRPVIHVVHEGPAGGLFDPAGGGSIIEDVTPIPGETVVHKRLPNAFADTDLAEQLAAIGNPPLILVGFMTHMCISSTARAALDLGLTTTIAADATATRSLPQPLSPPHPTSTSTGAHQPVSAEALQLAALAALADRFSVIADTASLLADG